MGNEDPRILIYSQDGFGLGHLRRNLNICVDIKKICPGASILIIADSPVAPFFDLPPKCDFVKIPTIIKVDMGVWRPNGLTMNYQEVLSIRTDIIQNVLIAFKPHVFLVDHMPHGALGELSLPLETLRSQCPETKVILGLRDILGAPETICKQWQEEGAYSVAEHYYDSVCVYGCSDLFDLAHEYEFPKSLLSKTHYHGYVCRSENEPEFDEGVLHNLFPDFSGKLVLVTGGGGHDASYFMDTFINAVSTVSSQVDFHSVIATGPFMHPTQFRLLTEKAAGLPIAVTPTGPDAVRLIERADLVICMGGYNTVGEVLQLRKNAIVIPRSGPSAEQIMRSQIMSERGLLSTLRPDQISAESLGELIVNKLQNGHPMNEKMIPELIGASNMASFMLAAI